MTLRNPPGSPPASVQPTRQGSQADFSRSSLLGFFPLQPVLHPSLHAYGTHTSHPYSYPWPSCKNLTFTHALPPLQFIKLSVLQYVGDTKVCYIQMRVWMGTLLQHGEMCLLSTMLIVELC